MSDPFDIHEESEHSRKEAVVYWFGTTGDKKEVILIWIGMNFHRLYGAPTVLYKDPKNPDKGKMLFSSMEN